MLFLSRQICARPHLTQRRSTTGSKIAWALIPSFCVYSTPPARDGQDGKHDDAPRLTGKSREVDCDGDVQPASWEGAGTDGEEELSDEEK